MPRFLVDESVGIRVAGFLKLQNYDAVSVTEDMREALDDLLIARALREGRILVTNDKELASMALSHGIAGVLLFRLEDGRFDNKLKVLRRLLKEYVARMEGSIIVASERRTRIRSV